MKTIEDKKILRDRMWIIKNKKTIRAKTLYDGKMKWFHLGVTEKIKHLSDLQLKIIAVNKFSKKFNKGFLLKKLGRWQDREPIEHKDEKGYIRMNPRSDWDWIRNNPYRKNNKNPILKHRYIMEKHLGRYLKPHEEVHHKNTIRDDNSLENLELWDTSHPKGGRVKDRIKWAKRFLKLHGYEISKI